ncbi:dihydrolipoyl dehydrogenase [Halovivax limisalsi]|uniref:dihydrolipoyl dehydrogenase n=1 Tax=Halovivax limisalsi TaxID=1453760 RepID=UPI001FFCADEC|nr:dihydrolipoyl dehydrogenase [Halovivax limisalsi]
MRTFDVVVLGGGSGSQVATAAAKQGFEAAVVEPGPIGGACITRGCVPSKGLIHRADLCETIRRADRFGVDATLDGIEYGAVVDRVHDTVFEKADRAAESLESTENVTLYDAAGRFVDDREIELDGGDADGERIRGEHVVIAVGGRPVVPPIDGVEDVEILTSDDALYLDSAPDSLAIVGGGYIGVELGHFFDAVGVDVTIVGRSDVLVPRESRAVSEAVTRSLSDRCTVRAGHEATEIRASDDGGRVLLAEPATEGGDDDDANGGEAIEIRADEILLATGRRPNTDDLGLDATGVETTDDGHVSTDETLETDVDGVWALGDVLPADPFKHVADREAEVVGTNVLARLREDGGERGSDPETMDRDVVPHAIFTDPRVASVGPTPAALDEDDIEYDAVRVGYDVAPLGLLLDEPEAFVQVLTAADGESILGCHVVGPDAPVLIQEVVSAMTVGGGAVEDVLDPIHVHPALSEAVLGAFAACASREISTAPDWRDVGSESE